MKTIFLILTIFTLFACNKPKDTENQYNLDANIQFSVFNSENEDLLNPNTPNHIVEPEIKLFYVVNGITKEVFNPHLDFPRNIHIFKHETEYRIDVFLNTTDTANKPVTYIKWNNTDIDTITATYIRTNNAVIKNKIWLNGNLIWDRSLNQDEYYKLVK